MACYGKPPSAGGRVVARLLFGPTPPPFHAVSLPLPICQGVEDTPQPRLLSSGRPVSKRKKVRDFHIRPLPNRNRYGCLLYDKAPEVELGDSGGQAELRPDCGLHFPCGMLLWMPLSPSRKPDRSSSVHAIMPPSQGARESPISAAGSPRCPGSRSGPLFATAE